MSSFVRSLTCKLPSVAISPSVVNLISFVIERSDVVQFHQWLGLVPALPLMPATKFPLSQPSPVEEFSASEHPLLPPDAPGKGSGEDPSISSAPRGGLGRSVPFLLSRLRRFRLGPGMITRLDLGVFVYTMAGQSPLTLAYQACSTHEGIRHGSI